MLDAMRELGGTASLHDLNARIAERAVMDFAANPHWRDKVRQTIYYHASQCDIYTPSHPDLFRAVRGKGQGVWGLRDNMRPAGNQSVTPSGSPGGAPSRTLEERAQARQSRRRERGRRIAVVNTEPEWFYFLRDAVPAQRVNFWAPSAWNVSHLEQGARVYFRLKGSGGQVGGWGRFVRYQNATVTAAWRAFGPANGVSSRAALLERLRRIARDPTLNADHEIGCIILDDPVLLPDEAFRTTAALGVDYPRTVQKFKYFERDSLPLGEEEVADKAPFQLVPASDRTTKETEVKDRAGQERFRREVREAYGYACAITGVAHVEALDAAHVQPHVGPASNHVQNGLLLRVDLHRLFDAGLLTVDQELRVQVSPLVTAAAYQALAGTRLRLPEAASARPSAEALAFHRASVFRG